MRGKNSISNRPGNAMRQLTVCVVAVAATLAATLVAFAPAASAATVTATSKASTQRISNPGASVLVDIATRPATGGFATPNTSVANCPDRPDFFAIYTRYHGNVCYANAGQIFYGNEPPITTWTTYGICTGNNSGAISFFLDGWWYNQQPFGDHTCYDFFHASGTTVEVAGFDIY
jgi:hypothetical protein